MQEQMRWDNWLLTQSGKLVPRTTSGVLSMDNTKSETPGPTPTEEQLDFEDWWSEKLRRKYGIDPAIAEDDHEEDEQEEDSYPLD